MTPHVEQVLDATHDRLDLWQAAAEAELQDLLTRASELRIQINEAKTATKKKYFEKKFKKVTNDVLAMLATSERIKQHRSQSVAPIEPSQDSLNDVTPVSTT